MKIGQWFYEKNWNSNLWGLWSWRWNSINEVSYERAGFSPYSPKGRTPEILKISWSKQRFKCCLHPSSKICHFPELRPPGLCPARRNAGVICKTHLLTPGDGASWLRHVPQNRDAQYRHGRKMSVTILTHMCVIVSHFTTLRHLVCQWDRHFLQACLFLKCASLASHFHEMVCHMFDSNVRRWNVMVCHFLWRKVRHGIKMYDSHRYNDAPFPGVKRCVLQMTSA